MVIWVFAGGGYTELGGLFIFLNRQFESHKFIRKTPVRQKPGPKPGRDASFHALGQTGQALANQVSYFLSRCDPEDECDAILIIDDLDCHDQSELTRMFLDVLGGIESFSNTRVLIGFAKPEIEAWLVADWEGTFARNKDLQNHQVGIRRQLTQAYQDLTEAGDINDPENFSYYDTEKNSCHDKLSDVMIQIVLETSGIHFSKAIHSSLMLRDVRAEIIANRCPVFRDLYRQLMTVSNENIR